MKQAIPDVTDLFKEDEKIIVDKLKPLSAFTPIKVTDDQIKLGLQKRKREAQARR